MSDRTFRDREILSAAQAKGSAATLGAYLRLSGPGWLQSAITLGGGSLAGALYIGMTGGYSLLWVQLLAMFCGVVMLSAISYVTLSTGKRPYGAMNEHVNPVLGTAWITATILANMIFILPQFSLAYDALNTNLLPDLVNGSRESKYVVSGILAAIALAVVLMSLKPGWMSKMFDLLLKLIVGAIVLCFVFAVVQLAMQGLINTDLLMGFIPDLSRLTEPAPAINQLLISDSITEEARSFWDKQLVTYKQEKMIASAAAAVGINMTFLLPYSMLARGWDKTFRGLARWDLITGMAIPFVVVTSCIVITTGYGFHGKADDALLSQDPAVIATSPFFGTVAGKLGGEKGKFKAVGDNDSLKELDSLGLSSDKEAKNEFLAKMIAEMSEEERTLAVALAKPNTQQLAKSLEPLLGEQNSNLVFGIGVLGMAFSTIIILSLINGFAFGEIFGDYQDTTCRVVGSVLALAVGLCWVVLWDGQSKTYLAIVAGTFAILLLPIAYLAFLLMMNNRELMGKEKPTGLRMSVWNILMVFSLAIVSLAAYISLQAKISDPKTGGMVLGGVITFGLLVLVGFSATFRGYRSARLPSETDKK
jgi:Mn2+/Fe2+ NRAMP family transporter